MGKEGIRLGGDQKRDTVEGDKGVGAGVKEKNSSAKSVK